MSESQTIELDNVGPIEHLSIPIPEDGGVVVLRGHNGSGKSHALNGVESLYSKDSRKGLRNSDGVPSGSINGLGVAVRLGRSNTVRGELVCESLDGRVDPSLLVDPGIKDPAKADSKRLASIIRLGNIKVTAEQWATALKDVADVVAVADMVDDDPIVTADRIRRRLHEAALQDERLAKDKSNEAATLSKSISEIDTDAESDDSKLSKAFEEATAALTKAEAQDRQHASAILIEAGTKEKLAAIPVSPLEPIQDELSVIACEMVSVSDQVRDLNEKLQELRDSEQALATSKAAAEAELEKRVQLYDQRDKLEAILRREIPAEVDISELAKLQGAKDKARQDVQLGEVVRRALETRQTAKTLADQSTELADRGVQLRDVARSTDSVLEQSLVDGGFEEIKVHDGRLCVKSDRGIEPFSDLSHGERWRMALDLAAAGLPSGAVLPVCQEAFESLDPGNREHINKLARDRGLVIVTAEATDGELRAEVLQ